MQAQRLTRPCRRQPQQAQRVDAPAAKETRKLPLPPPTPRASVECCRKKHSRNGRRCGREKTRNASVAQQNATVRRRQAPRANPQRRQGRITRVRGSPTQRPCSSRQKEDYTAHEALCAQAARVAFSRHRRALPPASPSSATRTPCPRPHQHMPCYYAPAQASAAGGSVRRPYRQGREAEKKKEGASASPKYSQPRDACRPCR